MQLMREIYFPAQLLSILIFLSGRGVVYLYIQAAFGISANSNGIADMDTIKHNLLLADDDTDDCLFFKEALADLPVPVSLETVNDGVELMQLLSSKTKKLPDLLFLDLNMPRKNGFECLSEIKAADTLKSLPVIIFTTSLNMEMLNLLYQKGAYHYIRKPGEYSKLKKIILEVLNATARDDCKQPAKDKFILQP
jgi:CheY-like chemotaxis protein